MNSNNIFITIPHQSTVAISPNPLAVLSDVLIHTSLRDPQVVLPTIVSGLSAEHLLRMIGLLSPSLRAIDSNITHYSKLAIDGGRVYYGPRECRLGERLCDRAHDVSTVDVTLA